MFKRLFWLIVGLALGSGGSFWVMRKVRRVMERLMPERLTQDVLTGARSVGADLRAALDDGKAGMREREVELRAEIERRQAARTPPRDPGGGGRPVDGRRPAGR